MKRLLFSFMFVLSGMFFFSNSTAQSGLFIDTSYTADQMVMDFFDQGCVSISNVQFTGAPSQLAFFQGANTSLNLNAGIFISTGNVFDAIGPNTSGSTTSNMGMAGDTYLENATGFPTNDAAVLEFDLQTTDPNLDFEYIFGSEEYPEFVGSSFNDAFAFLIDDQGTIENISMIPGSSTIVSINTVNDNTNSQYYVDNANDTDVEFDGRTVSLPASFTANTTLTYHVKIVVADVSDSAFDSGVFIGVQSLCGDSLLTPPSGFVAELPNPDGNTVVFDNQSSYATDYLWKFGDGNSSSEKSPTHTYAQDGIYEIELITYNYCCSDTSKTEINIGNVTSTDPVDVLPFKLFPNPFSDLIQLDLPWNEEGTIRIFDPLGKLVFQRRSIGQTNLSLGHLPKGVYMFQLETSEGRFTQRINKQ